MSRDARELAAAAAASTALAAASFWRVWPRLSTAVPTRSLFDLGGNLWIQWWGPFALSRGLDPFFTRWHFFPTGSVLSVDSWVMTWLVAWPLAGRLNPVARYNVLAVFSYAATGAAAYAFFGLFARSRWARALAATAVTYSSYRQYCLAGSHSDQLQTQWPVLLALAFVAAARERFSTRSLAWLCAAAAACAYNEQRTFLMTALVCATYAAALPAFGAWHSDYSGRRRSAAWAAPALLLLLALALLPLARSGLAALGSAAPGYGRRPGSMRVGLADLLVPPPLHALRALGVLAFDGGLAESAQGYVNALWLALAGAGFWLRRREPEGRALAAALAVSALLEAARWPLVRVPVLGWLHVPARFALTTSLFGGALAARGWEAAESRLGRPAAAAAACALLAALALETNPLWVPLREVWEPDAGALTRLSAQEGAVVDLPLPALDPLVREANGRGCLRATRHQLPLVDGELSAPSPQARAFLATDADVSALSGCQAGGSCAGLDARWLSLRARGVRWVVADAVAPEDPLRAGLSRSRALRETDRAPGFAVYEIVEAGR